ISKIRLLHRIIATSYKGNGFFVRSFFIMPNTIKFKPYYNNVQYTHSELPQFILNKKQFEKLSFTSKLLYFVIYRKNVKPYTKKSVRTNEELYFSMTCDEMMGAMHVSKNTVRTCKKELL